MNTMTKVALSVAIALSTASGALAATKHPTQHRAAITHQVPAGAYSAYGFQGTVGSSQRTYPNSQTDEGSPAARPGQPDWQAWEG
jgi:hypothetical protein